MDTQVADTLLGSLVDGRYRIRARVARGGMATVYTAVDERLERIVALKIIHPTQAGDPRFLDRFTDEAKTIARLTHPNVVAVYDQGNHNGLPYLVMEYVRGRTLRDLLVERRRLNPAEALAILEQMLAAIAASHRAGLVHRDVKPENVLVAEAPSGGSGNLIDSVVKVADFGLARAVEVSADDDSGDGHLMATVAYVAPELVTDGQTDARTDVYSAGIVLFEMLTGRVPYDGDKPVQVAWQHVDNDVPPPSKVVPGSPAVLDDLVARATCRDPAGRPTDAGALLAEVQTVRDGLGVANAETALLRQVAEPTAVVRTVQPTQRPAWARLPDQKEQSPRRRRGAADAVPAPTAQHPAVHHGAAHHGGGLHGASRHGATRYHPVDGPAGGDRRNRTVLVAALVALGLVLVGGGWWVAIGRYSPAPQLVNMTRAQAEAAATRDGVRLSFASGRYDEKVERDVVLSQDPPANGRVVRGGTITLVLSLGPERYPVPDVVGKEAGLARSELEGLNLVVKPGPERFDDNVPKGTVIAVAPGVGEKVKPGDPVTITLSKGKAPITVPNLVGKNINEVRGQLQQRGLTAVEVYKDSEKPKDEVIAQDPADGTGVEKGAKVNLEVSKGPALVVVPKVTDLPCQQAKQALEALQLRVRVDFNPNGTVRFQNPPENSQAAPQSEVVIGCF